MGIVSHIISYGYLCVSNVLWVEVDGFTHCPTTWALGAKRLSTIWMSAFWPVSRLKKNFANQESAQYLKNVKSDNIVKNRTQIPNFVRFREAVFEIIEVFRLLPRFVQNLCNKGYLSKNLFQHINHVFVYSMLPFEKTIRSFFCRICLFLTINQMLTYALHCYTSAMATSF